LLRYCRALETEKEVTEHESLHQKCITCIAVTKNGSYFVTGKLTVGIIGYSGAVLKLFL
jgi:hypothetical protein